LNGVGQNARTAYAEARPEDAKEIANLFPAARQGATPYLDEPLTDDEWREWFAGAVGDRPMPWGDGR
jgi:hypothetical protein